MPAISRRTFIRATALAGVAAVLPSGGSAVRAMGPGGGGMGPGGGGGVTVIDPPVGQAFRQPALIANQSSDPGIVEVALEARRAAVDVNGTTANLITYNGPHPGPLIRVRQDQLLRINFRNELPDDDAINYLGHPVRMTNLHTHGLHVSPGDNANGTHADNMMVMLAPGESTVYEYDLSEAPGGQPQLLPSAHPRQRVRPDVGRPVGAARRRGRGAGAVRFQ